MSPRALVLSLGVSGFAVGLWLNTSLKPRSSSGDMHLISWSIVTLVEALPATRPASRLDDASESWKRHFTVPCRLDRDM